jgi:hypothetical protein
MTKIFEFAKKNAVVLIAAAAAVITSFIVPPDKEYLGYFDFKTLSCLFCVLCVVGALRNIRFFYTIAKAIVKSSKNLIDGVSNYQEIAGKGITATLNGKNVICSNYKFLEENGVKFNKIEELATIVYLAVDGKYAGAVLLTDELRKEAYGAIHELYEYGAQKTVQSPCILINQHILSFVN